MVAMISRLLQDKVNDDLIEDLSRHVKLYLANMCNLQLALDSESSDEGRKKLKVESTSNLVGMLNLPEHMRQYGSLQWYWEGGVHREGLL